jgi:CelD/BcsL family acetyltransferase involved in cellulose biosynthesis/peptidoglycan/xylan/chitin deacetylase (PgdA/CDA1 family)
MKIKEIRSEAELRALRPAWEGLLRTSPANTIFLSWEWVTAWWEAYGQSRDLDILAAFDEAGVLRGIAPFLRQRLRRYGQTVPVLSLIGDGSNDSDYLDLIIASGYEEQVMQAFQACWTDRHRGAVLMLNEIPDCSPNLPLFRKVATESDCILTETHVDCATVRLPATWEQYLGMLRPRFRTKLRSLLRDLESRPEVRMEFCRTRQDLDRLLPVLFDLHTRRWMQDGKPGVFGWEQKRRFYRELSPALLDRGWLRLSWLEWKGRILACQYGFVYGVVYFQLQEGYEPASEHWHPGIGLRAWSIREFLKEGLREYDFLGGVGRHKTDWGAEVKRSARIVLAPNNFRNRLFCHGPDWEESAREAVKRIVPNKILMLRQKYLSQRSRTGLSPSRHGSPESSRTKWVRSGAANCYFHLRLPALMRPLREQYQLSVSSGGRSPRVSWNRRQEPFGRILCFHRVNDDYDPFFPAISTKLFEQEMDYLARHYKVVSLAELVDRLDGCSPEPVIAITFDDGYGDNYQNAFPVLQRYGLAATIFLTTGSLDSREPLWFEKLALAVKKTERESLDLEIDIPRRYWLRTLAERLDSNAGIFRLLQHMEDSERRSALDEILRRLGPVADTERRDKMLTWDQVRSMKARGIDFGGHTVTHPFLSRTSRDQMAWEAQECKQRIENELQSPVGFFAYPNGCEEDFQPWNKEVIRCAGYRAAVTSIWGANQPSTDRMELRRGGPWEGTPELFASKLDWYQFVNG